MFRGGDVALMAYTWQDGCYAVIDINRGEVVEWAAIGGARSLFQRARRPG